MLSQLLLYLLVPDLLKLAKRSRLSSAQNKLGSIYIPFENISGSVADISLDGALQMKFWSNPQNSFEKNNRA